MMAGKRHLPVEGAFNIRDLGGYETRAGNPIPWRRFLRSDSLHRIAPHEIRRLHDEGLRAVIDLRTGTEVAAAPNPFAAFPDVRYLNLPLFDDLSPQSLSEAAQEGDHPLFTFYMTALETRGDAICQILTEMAQIDDGAVLFNCTAGKDRTGIIAALLLGIAGVDRKEIIADYALTAEFIPDLVAEFLDISRAKGGDTESYARMLESPAETLAATMDAIRQKYGTFRTYLQSINLPESVRETLRARLNGTQG